MDEEFQKRKMNYDIDFDFEEEEEEQQNGISYITIIALFVAISGFVALSWYAYNSFKSSEEQNQIPIIVGNKSPYKVTTDEIENDINLDKEYFSHFNKKEAEINAKIVASNEEPISKQTLEENLLKAIAPKQKDEPKTEKIDEPLALSDDEVDLFADSLLKKDTQNNINKNTKIEEPNLEQNSVTNSEQPPKKELEQPVTKKENKVAVVSAVKEVKKSKDNLKTDNLKADNIKIEPKSKLSKKLQNKLKMNQRSSNNLAYKKPHSIVYHESFKVQLASFKSKAEALDFWQNFKSEQIDIIGGLANHIEQRDVKNQGVFYRLQLGSFVNYANARNLCSRLKNRNIDCFVVKS